MKPFNLFLVMAGILSVLISCSNHDDMILDSPGGNIRVSIQAGKDGKAVYSVLYRNLPVIENSSLGIIREDGDFYSGMKLDSVSPMTAVQESYSLLYGKTKEARYKANRRVFHLSNAAGGKMDVIFQVSDDGYNFERVTGNGAELAMAVLLLSGVHHYAETPRGMAAMPDYVRKMMSAIPVSWDETKFMDGFPGKFLVIARRTGEAWYVAGINAGREPKELNMKLPFIDQPNGILVTEDDILRSFALKNVTLNGEKSATVTSGQTVDLS